MAPKDTFTRCDNSPSFSALHKTLSLALEVWGFLEIVPTLADIANVHPESAGVSTSPKFRTLSLSCSQRPLLLRTTDRLPLTSHAERYTPPYDQLLPSNSIHLLRLVLRHSGLLTGLAHQLPFTPWQSAQPNVYERYHPTATVTATATTTATATATATPTATAPTTATPTATATATATPTATAPTTATPTATATTTATPTATAIATATPTPTPIIAAPDE
ncbi:hypothetical protein JAAARDRAFT_198805 [Jaapia argillacea MUCL 33604]|uniref:Uncharacterized protein n=1 Tax=Jaapia argillacea MUCL 33604 TaxID=933084 RepID=A0A067PLS4_9AGAM|nr:hypothetical protein JAAARDRAFT_198805 [Jaapia argillacea MUCL 33604]